MFTFKKNKKQWIIALSIIFVIFVIIALLLLTSSGYIRASDEYDYLHSDLGQIGKNLSSSGAIEWQQEVDNAKSTLTTYYIGISATSVLALITLIGDILLIINKKKAK